jgi:NADH:ubiquinone oxidoreductase subunit F (NADH-binding)
VGSQKLVDMLTSWSEGKGSAADVALIDDLSGALRLTSICGLGQVVPAPIASVLKHFRAEVESHILQRRCPAGVCPCGERAGGRAAQGVAAAKPGRA